MRWFNEDRLHGHRDDVPPAGFEAVRYAAGQTCPTGVEPNLLLKESEDEYGNVTSYEYDTVTDPAGTVTDFIDGSAGLRIQAKVPLPGGGTKNVGGYWTTDGRLVTFWD
ncbi:MAG: hypothetical protein ACK5O2_12355 [Microthrixaceae bacterium]